MQITIDTPYITISEWARRLGWFGLVTRREIEILIRPQEEGSKPAALFAGFAFKP